MFPALFCEDLPARSPFPMEQGKAFCSALSRSVRQHRFAGELLLTASSEPDASSHKVVDAMPDRGIEYEDMENVSEYR